MYAGGQRDGIGSGVLPSHFVVSLTLLLYCTANQAFNKPCSCSLNTLCWSLIVLIVYYWLALRSWQLCSNLQLGHSISVVMFTFVIDILGILVHPASRRVHWVKRWRHPALSSVSSSASSQVMSMSLRSCLTTSIQFFLGALAFSCNLSTPIV